MMQPKTQPENTAPARRWLVLALACAALIIVALVLAAANWIVSTHTVLPEKAKYHPRLLAWNYDGSQELVMAGLDGRNNATRLKRGGHVHETLHGYFLRYNGTWQALPDSIAPENPIVDRIFADNGVIVFGPVDLSEPFEGEYHLIKAGQVSTLFTAQQLFDAMLRSTRKAINTTHGYMQYSVSIHDICYEKSTGNITFCIKCSSQLNDNGVNKTQLVDCIWDGQQVKPAPLDVPHYSGHPYSGGWTRLVARSPVLPGKFYLAWQIESSDGKRHSFLEIEEDFDLASFNGDSVWMSDTWLNKAKRWDLQTWQVVEERDLDELVRSIPRKLFKEAKVVRYTCGRPD